MRLPSSENVTELMTWSLFGSLSPATTHTLFPRDTLFGTGIGGALLRISDGIQHYRRMSFTPPFTEGRVPSRVRIFLDASSSFPSHRSNRNDKWHTIRSHRHS